MWRTIFFLTPLVLTLTQATEKSFVKGKEYSKTSLLKTVKEFSNGRELEELNEYSKHLKKRGCRVLSKLSDEIQAIAYGDPKRNLTVDMSNENYEKNIQSSYNYTAELATSVNIDYEYMILDLLEIGCKLLYLEQKSFLDKILEKGNITTGLYTTEIYPLYEIIFKQSVKFKRKEMLHVCKTYGICKPHSRFNNYLQHFLNEILLLPDTEIGMIINLLSELVRDDKNFLILIKCDEPTLLLVKVLFTNTFQMKRSLIILRNLVRDRHNIFYAPYYEDKLRIQAVRALLDIIDKAFYFKHGYKFAIDIHNTVKSIREWGVINDNFIEIDKDDQNHCKSYIRKFVNTVFKAIDFKKNDLNSYLIKTIITGNLENVQLFAKLFRNGYKGVYSVD